MAEPTENEVKVFGEDLRIVFTGSAACIDITKPRQCPKCGNHSIDMVFEGTIFVDLPLPAEILDLPDDEDLSEPAVEYIIADGHTGFRLQCRHGGCEHEWLDKTFEEKYG